MARRQNVRVDLYLTPELYEAVEAEAVRTGVTRSEVIRQCVRTRFPDPVSGHTFPNQIGEASVSGHAQPPVSGHDDHTCPDTPPVLVSGHNPDPCPDTPPEPPEGAEPDLATLLDDIEVGSRVAPTTGLYVGVRGRVTRLVEGKATVEFKTAQGNVLTATLAVDQLQAL